MIELGHGGLVQDFRMRTPDGHVLWFSLKARPVVGSDGEVIRLVGTLTDVTDTKIAAERLARRHPSPLTSLPNRELFPTGSSRIGPRKERPGSASHRDGDRHGSLQTVNELAGFGGG